MSYPEPRRVVLTLADLRRLTILERARACAVVGIDDREIGPLLRGVTARDVDPKMLETGVLLFYALAWQLERRIDPAVSFEAAQTWDVALDLDGDPDPVAEAEAHASVEAAIATGLPPAIAGELTLAQIDAYAEIRGTEQSGHRPRARRRAGARR